MNNLALYSNIVLGILLLYSYFYLYSKNSGVVKKLWGSIKGIERKLTIVSMIITGILYLLTIYYISFHTDKLDKNKINDIIKYQVILIIASMLWMPLSIKYLENKQVLTKIAIILILFVVAMSSLAILLKINKLDDTSKYKNYALIGSGFLFFHTFCLDFLNWNYNFF